MCANHNNNSPNLGIGNTFLIRDNYQSSDYDLIERIDLIEI